MWRASIFTTSVVQEYFCIKGDSPSFELLALLLQVLYLCAEAFKVLQDSGERAIRSVWKLDLCYGSTGREHDLCYVRRYTPIVYKRSMDVD